MDRELRRDVEHVEVRREEERHDNAAAEGATLGTFTEAAGGIAAIVLGILGLASIVPTTLAAVGIIVIGAALLTEGTAVMAEFAQMSRDQLEYGNSRGVSEAGGGVMLEFLGGIGVIVLGILALLGLAPVTLEAISIIAYGGTLILAGGMLTSTMSMSSDNDAGAQMARNAVMGTRGLEVIIGIGGVVLGILALVGINPLTLVLVSILGFGSAVLLTGTAITSRILAIMAR